MLIKSSKEEHILALTIHHSIGDEWSTKIINQELAELYNAKLKVESISFLLLVYNMPILQYGKENI